MYGVFISNFKIFRLFQLEKADRRFATCTRGDFFGLWNIIAGIWILTRVFKRCLGVLFFIANFSFVLVEGRLDGIP